MSVEQDNSPLGVLIFVLCSPWLHHSISMVRPFVMMIIFIFGFSVGCLVAEQSCFGALLAECGEALRFACFTFAGFGERGGVGEAA